MEELNRCQKSPRSWRRWNSWRIWPGGSAGATAVASPPDRRVTKDDIGVASASVAVNNAAVSGCSSGTASSRSHNPSSSPGRNGQLSKQGTLTIVRRSSGKNKSISGGNFESSPSPHNPDTSYLSSQSVDLEEILDNVDLTTDSLPAVDTPDACDKAALRLRCLLRQLQHGEISAELLQRNLHYAARVLEAVFIDETKCNLNSVLLDFVMRAFCFPDASCRMKLITLVQLLDDQSFS